MAALQNGAIVVIRQAVGQDDALVWGRDVAQRLANFVPKVHSDIKVRFWMGLYKLEMDDRGLLWSGETPKGEKMFRGVVEFCHNMGFHVVAEGVETENQRAFVASSGADYIQGYFYYKPLPASEAYKVLDKTRKG